MTLNLPFESLYLLYRLQETGFSAYLVGGAVRDILINSLKSQLKLDSDIFTKDFDFTTNAKPEEIQDIFKESFYENQFGTVSITHENLLEELKNLGFILPEKDLSNSAPKSETRPKLIDLKKAKKIHTSLQNKANEANNKMSDQGKEKPLFPPFEMTTFRSDGSYIDHRRPNEVEWGQNIEDDLERRDFTINALAIKVEPKFLKEIFSQKKELTSTYLLKKDDWQLIDQHQGYQDLLEGKIRTVGDAKKRFSEDALRMLRAIRFSVQLGMEIEEGTLKAIKNLAQSIRFVSFERIGAEILKILSSNDPARGIELLDETKLIEEIIPELKLGKNMQQRGHHTTDVWVHSLDCLRHCPSPDPIVRLSALLHDVGKPNSYHEDNQKITFYSHDIIGSRIASKIAKRLRLSNKDVQRVFTLVRYHMFYYQPEHTDASIRRFIKRVGLENIDDILDLREGDRLGSGARKTSWRLEEMKERVIEQLNQPMDLTDLAIDGHDLMTEFNLKPGPILGEVLNSLLELVLNKPELNERESLLKEAAKIL